MRYRSLRWRVGLIGALAIFATLALSIIGLTILFDRHVQRVAVADLEARAFAIAAMVEPDGSDGPRFRQMAVDPLYEQPFSGHYWQVELGNDIQRSRSLWDFSFPASEHQLPAGTTQALEIAGPQGEPLLAVETLLSVGTGSASLPLRITVATDRETLDDARAGFLMDVLPYIVALAALLVLASWAQVTLGLRPLTAVVDRLAQLRAGRLIRIGADLPTEVLPLAGEIDQLLDERESELMRVRNRAGDLAHGLKTPLQALLGDAALLRDRGEDELAGSVENIATAMKRHVDRELNRAIIRSDTQSAGADPLVIVERVVEVLRRTPNGASLAWRIGIPKGLSVRIDPDDLTEAVGALAENAAKHASGSVSINARVQGDEVEIAVSDDGAGVPEQDLDRLVKRGIRLDERMDGSGMGLAIVADIMDAVGGQIILRNQYPGLIALLRLRRGPAKP